MSKPNFGGCSALLYGPPKIGKSTFCSELNGAFFIDTEGGLKWAVPQERKISLTSWKQFQGIVKDFVDSGEAINNNGKTVKPLHMVVDTVDVLWVYCTEYVCRKFSFEHPSDESYGKGYQVLRYEFQKYLARLNSRQEPMILISHSKSTEVRGRGSNRTSRVVPSIPNSAREVIMPMVDVIAYCGFDIDDDTIKSDRAMLFSPEEGLEAGDRSGMLPNAMTLDPNNLKKYFGNEKRGKKSEGKKGGRKRGVKRRKRS